MISNPRNQQTMKANDTRKWLKREGIVSPELKDKPFKITNKRDRSTFAFSKREPYIHMLNKLLERFTMNDLILTHHFIN